MKVLLSLLLSLPLFAKALDQQTPDGVRVVGKGGGFAEMQAYALDKKLPALLQLCLQNCDLDLQEKSVLQKYLQNEKDNSGSLLAINTTCVAPYLHVADGSVDACYLYEERLSSFGPEPKSTNKIAEIILSLRLSSGNETVLAKLIPKILRNLQSEHEVFVLQAAQLHLWKLNPDTTQSPYLTLETPLQSLDLGESLVQTLACSENTVQWNLANVLVQANQVRAEVAWNCGSRSYRAILLMSLAFQDETKPTVQFRIFNKEAF